MEGVSYSLSDCLDVLREMQVDVSEMMGSAVHLHVTSQGKDVIIIVQTMDLRGPNHISLTTGQKIAFTFGGNVVHLFDRESGKNLEA